MSGANGPMCAFCGLPLPASTIVLGDGASHLGGGCVGALKARIAGLEGEKAELLRIVEQLKSPYDYVRSALGQIDAQRVAPPDTAVVVMVSDSGHKIGAPIGVLRAFRTFLRQFPYGHSADDPNADPPRSKIILSH